MHMRASGNQAPPRCGLALIVIVGILGVMAVLGTAFVIIARLERRASQQRIHATRALLLARSGIEDALARLSAGQKPEFLQNRYGGEDVDLSGGALSPAEAAQEIFRPGQADVETCPLRFAQRPSFAVLLANSPLSVPADDRQRAFSGFLSGDAAPLGNTYALRIEDESAKININGGLLDALDRDGDGIPDFRDALVRPAAAPITSNAGWGWNGQLCRILNVLGSQPALGRPNLGTDLLARRPLGGYRTIEEACSLLGATTDLSPWLTVSSWVDQEVIRPNSPTWSSNWADLSRIKAERGLLLSWKKGGARPST